MRKAAFRAYVRLLVATVGGALFLFVGFNALVNPFNLYDGIRISRFNDYKYRLVKYQRLSKPAEIRRLHPECLIFGTSRMQVAIDPAHPGWGKCRAYNMALNNAGIYESWRYFQHAVAIQRPQQVVLELEQIYGDRAQVGFSEERLLVNADGSRNPLWRGRYGQDIVAGLISAKAFRASWGTVFPSYERRPRGPENGFWEYTPVDGKMLRQGQRELFRELEQTAFGGSQAKRPDRPLSFKDVPASMQPRDADSHAGGNQYLRAILRAAHRDNIRMHLVIAPSHARLWSGFLEAGRWRDFESRKRMMVYINEDEARRANRAPFPLWDFSGFNSCTTEAVPPPDDRQTRMRWYWEAQHFTKELGDRMLDRILGSRDAERPVPRDFGVQIDSRNLDAHLAAIRMAGDRWRQTHVQDTVEIEEIIYGRAH